MSQQCRKCGAPVAFRYEPASIYAESFLLCQECAEPHKHLPSKPGMGFSSGPCLIPFAERCEICQKPAEPGSRLSFIGQEGGMGGAEIEILAHAACGAEFGLEAAKAKA